MGVKMTHAPRPSLALALSLALLCLACAACDRRAATRPDGPTRIAVSVPPLVWVARGLAPEDAEVTMLTPPGASEHTYEPPPSAVRALINADVLVLVGLGIERASIHTVSDNPRPWRRDVWFDRVAGIENDGAHDHDHAHDHHHDHSHAGADPHLWLDPSLMAKLVSAVRGAIEDSLRGRGLLTDAEQARLLASEARLLAEIEAVDAEHKQALARLTARELVTHHNAFPRLAERYGLTVAAVIRPIHVVEPTPGDLERAVETIRARGVKAIFVEPQYSQQAARRIAEMTDVRVEQVDVMGDGDWPGMMRKNLAAIVRGLGDGTPAPE